MKSVSIFKKTNFKKNLCKSFAVDLKKYMFYYQNLYIYLLYVFFAHYKRANLTLFLLLKSAITGELYPLVCLSKIIIMGCY